MLVLNRVPTDRNVQKLMIPNEKIEKFLRRPIAVQIPNDEATALNAMSKGVLIVAQRDRSRSPVKELMQLSELLYTQLMGSETEGASGESGTKDTRNPLSGIFKR
jgi:Flp pilus assembly CpaE family ATPase